jgi:4-hydroxyphenylpyruvate dioxygenase
MKHSIATVSLSGTLTEKVKAIAKAKYDGVELFENDLLASNVKPEELRKMLEDLNLTLVGLQPFRDYEAMPEPFKSRNLERAKHKFELMHRLGTKKLFICSNTSIHTINHLDKAAEDLFDIAELAKQHDFEIGYEALSWGRFVNTYHQSVEIVRRANHPNLGNILDNFHISVLGSTFEDIYTIPKDKFTMVQVADAPKYDMGAMHLGRHYRCFPGQGSYPVVEFLNAVKATGYDGYLSHEIFSDEFRSSLIEPVALDGKRSLIWLEKMTSNSINTSNENATSQQLQKIEWIEFATSAEKQTALIHILEAIGFVEAGKHTSKDAYLYQLGEVNISVNRAESVQQFSPNSICSIGFQSSNNTLFQKWAKELRYKWQWGNQPKRSQSLLSVKGIGDLNYDFIEGNDDFLSEEFEIKKQSIASNGILKIDHLGHSVGAEYHQSNTLFYRAFLGLKVEESIEILDPRGIVYSRVAKNESRNIRIPLSSTLSQGTSIQQFTRQKGAGIQQIAFESNDIFKTAQSILDKSLILPIPSNYYEDLKAKTQLSDELLKQMEECNILYDRQADGEFFHFYFKELNGLFFEVVQRKGMYERYGEINAQIRLAAQERDRVKS